VNITDFSPPPEIEHCVISCGRATARLYAVADKAARAGARLTFLVRYVDDALADFARERQVNVLPAAGYIDQISTATQHEAIRRILAGGHVTAQGFVDHSVGRFEYRRPHTVIRALSEASRLANASTRVVTAVLSLHRTGSNFLRDLIGLTVSGNVDVFHEHSVPHALSEQGPSPRQLLKAARRVQILSAARRFIFICERDPVERLISYFQERHMALLMQSFDPGTGSFRDRAAIQRTFDAWVARQAQSQRDWYRKRLAVHFGLGPLDCAPTDDGFFLGTHGENTLVVVPTKRLSALREELAGAFGGGAYDTIATNTIRRRGGAAIDATFRRDIRFDPAVEEMLAQIPEVAYCLADPGAERARRAG
jgi:hypothetical protein